MLPWHIIFSFFLWKRTKLRHQLIIVKIVQVGAICPLNTAGSVYGWKASEGSCHHCISNSYRLVGSRTWSLAGFSTCVHVWQCSRVGSQWGIVSMLLHWQLLLIGWDGWAERGWSSGAEMKGRREPWRHFYNLCSPNSIQQKYVKKPCHICFESSEEK